MRVIIIALVAAWSFAAAAGDRPTATLTRP
jgi:hypothetical protein